MTICGLSCIRLASRSKWLNVFASRRLNCTDKGTYKRGSVGCVVEELKARGVLKVAGDEAIPFLQGLITNDMKHLEGNASKSMYTMFLNSKGRVMYDAIIYKDAKAPGVYVECDKSVVKAMEKHLKMFKVKRKIDISVADNCKVWVVFSADNFVDVVKNDNSGVGETMQERVVPCQGNLPNALDGQSESNNDVINCLSQESLCASVDPRLAALGVRILSGDDVNVASIAESKGVQSVGEGHVSYRTLRYRLGVAEGADELPYGKCFPLEMNCDYLHGVSFHKGCYIGQELTARTHHTGVVRKRLMPIYLDTTVTSVDHKLDMDAPIESTNQPTKAVGKLRGIEGNVAIGLVRISEALNAGKLRIGQWTGYTVKPHWWPKEAPKDTASLSSKQE